MVAEDATIMAEILEEEVPLLEETEVLHQDAKEALEAKETLVPEKVVSEEIHLGKKVFLIKDHEEKVQKELQDVPKALATAQDQGDQGETNFFS